MKRKCDGKKTYRVSESEKVQGSGREEKCVEGNEERTGRVKEEKGKEK